MVGEQDFLDARDRTRGSILLRFRQDPFVDDPLDLADEVYATAWARRHSYDPEFGNIDAWIHGIATHLHLNHRRRYRRRRRSTGSERGREFELGPEELVVAAISAAAVLQRIASVAVQLPDVEIDLLDQVITAAAAGLPALLAPTQHVRLHRLRKRLRPLTDTEG